jgi:hypothetical protein
MRTGDQTQLRPWVLVIGFSGLLGLMAGLAELTAVGTTGPWFGPGISMTVYGLALAMGAALVLVTTVVAGLRIASIDSGMHRIEARVESMRDVAAFKRSQPGRGRSPAPRTDLEVELESIVFGGKAPAMAIDRASHDSLVDIDEVVQVIPAPRREETLRALLRERIALRELRVRVRNLAAGPFIAGLTFLAAAAVMLPGSDGFATTHYQLNTALVLFLSYGLAPLVAWTAMAMALLNVRRAPA